MTFDDDARAIKQALLRRPRQEVAFRPERALVSLPGHEPAIEWTIKRVEVVSIIDPGILRDAYAARGPRVIARKIRQMRRRFRRNFDPAYRHYR